MPNTPINTLLGQVLREVDKNYTVSDSNQEKLVVIDNQGQTYAQKPGMLGILKTYRYFIVNTVKVITHNGYLCTLNHRDGLSNIQADYRIKCQPEDASTLVRFIQSYALVSDAPGSVIREEVEKYHKSHTLTENFLSKKSTVTGMIIDRLKAIGLTVLSINLDIEGHAKTLMPLEINVSSFNVILLGGTPKATMALQAKIISRAGQDVKTINADLSKSAYEEGILKIVRNHIAGNITPDELFLHHHTRVRNEAETAVNNWLQNYGRVLDEFILTLHKNGSLDAIVIQAPSFIDIRIRNSRQQLQIKYKCELVADPALHARVYLFPANTVEIEEVIKDTIKNTMANEIDAEQFIDELNTGVSSLLASAIDDRIASWGRKVGYLQLETNAGKLPGHFEVDHNIECLSKDGYPVAVKNKLLLQRDFRSAKVFEASQVADLEKWSRSELDRITKRFIISKTYNELKYLFDDKEVRAEMRLEAAKIGYDVSQLIVMPEFKGEAITNNFNITYKDHNLSSKVDGVPVAISIEMEVVIHDYSKVVKLLKPKETLTERMQRTIDNKMRQFFHGVHPDRFYLRFHSRDAGENDSLEGEIKTLLSESLYSEYGAEVRSVGVNPLNTRIILRLKQLQAGDFYCDFEDKSGLFKYKCKINVLHIDPERWEVFNNKGYKLRVDGDDDSERSDIRTHIREYLENALNTSIVPDFKRKVIADHATFVERIEETYPALIVEIREFFGLVIQLLRPVNLLSPTDTTRIEIKALYEIEKIRLETKVIMNSTMLEEQKKRLEFLYEQRREIEKEGGLTNLPSRQKLNDEIKALEQALQEGAQRLCLGDPFDQLPYNNAGSVSGAQASGDNPTIEN